MCQLNSMIRPLMSFSSAVERSQERMAMYWARGRERIEVERVANWAQQGTETLFVVR